MLAPDPRFAAIDGLDGTTFELAIVDLLTLLGYEDIERIGGFDKGADIVALAPDGVRVAVQAKRWSGAVRIGAIRQLADGMRHYGCERGIAVTNSFFTEPAIECAGRWEIELWDRRTLAEYVDGDAPPVDVTVCAECGARVSAGTTRWCLDHPARYGGNVFCRTHQNRRARRVP